ncbi:hypothetical protein [Streptomyces fradiae]|uniref:hypothetical protein n=1 Tax=Streptomyces fradiae TaxID=1906 RepID=UPI0035161CB7
MASSEYPLGTVQRTVASPTFFAKSSRLDALDRLPLLRRQRQALGEAHGAGLLRLTQGQEDLPVELLVEHGVLRRRGLRLGVVRATGARGQEEGGGAEHRARAGKASDHAHMTARAPGRLPSAQVTA